LSPFLEVSNATSAQLIKSSPVISSKYNSSVNLLYFNEVYEINMRCRESCEPLEVPCLFSELFPSLYDKDSTLIKFMLSHTTVIDHINLLYSTQMSFLSASPELPSPFIELEGSWPCSQQLATCLYPEPDEASLHPSNL